MNVIRHQAVTEHLGPAKRRILFQQPEVDLAVGNREEHVALFIPPLGDVVRALRNHDSGKSRESRDSTLKHLPSPSFQWLPSRLIPHRHRPRAELQPAHEPQVDTLR
jgi:hypothetical protein